MPTYGVELEMIGVPRRTLAAAVRSVVGGVLTEETDAEDPTITAWLIAADDGRVWRVEDDDSLSAAADERGEVVSPVLTEQDMSLLQRMVDGLAATGARADASCGVHVHLGVADCEVEHLNRMIDLLIDLEPIVFQRMLGIADPRKDYAKLMDPEFVRRFKERRPRTSAELFRLYYGDDTTARHRDRYDDSRYRGLNLHSVTVRGTVEFRYFNGTVSAERVLEYVRLCLAIADRAGLR